MPNAMPDRVNVSVTTRLTSPIAMMMPAEIGTMLMGFEKSTLFSLQIFAPRRPIMP